MNIKPLKVLLVSPLPPPVGGIASWTVNVLNYYNQSSKENIELALCDSSNKERRITSRSYFTRIYSGIINSLKTFNKVKKNLKHNPDVIHLVSSSSYSLLKDLLIIRLARRKNIATVTHWRFGRIPDLATRNNWEYKLLCHVIKKSTHSIVIDSKSFNLLKEKGFTNVLNVPNPIADELGLIAETIFHELKPRIANHLLFVGHVVTQKGIYELVEACKNSDKKIRLTIIGPYEEEVKQRLLTISENSKKGSWLEFLGALDKEEVLKHMKEHPILVLPSYTEGFPNVVLEAMAMGCAVIGTNVGAIPEMLDIGSETPSGICVPHGNTLALEEAINELIERPEIIQEFGRNGIRKVLDYYSMKVIFSKYCEVWNISLRKAP